MPHALLVLSTLLLAGAPATPAPAKPAPAKATPSKAFEMTEAELLRRTQELYDAVAPGNQEPWKAAYAEDCVFFDEKGRLMDKKALIEDVQPMPKGYTGSIKIARPQTRILGDTAIFSYDADETETIFGQALTARYHTTDTWMKRKGTWQIVASQTLRYYEDPAAIPADPKRLAAYVGTYQLTEGKQQTVRVEGDKLFLDRAGRPSTELFLESGDLFFRKGAEGRILFRANAAGAVEALVDRRNNEDVVWARVK